jgi:hypothetical protein
VNPLEQHPTEPAGKGKWGMVWKAELLTAKAAKKGREDRKENQGCFASFAAVLSALCG